MEFTRRDAPYVTPSSSVQSVMLHVLLALVPASLAYVWYFGFGFVFNLFIATLFCVGSEAVMMKLRGCEPAESLADLSALVTAALLTFALPALTPWWVTATASIFAIAVAKHLYGGLGYNIFNPAMVGYVVVLVAFPMYMNLWTAPRMGDIDYNYPDFYETIRYTLTGSLPEHLTFDAVSRATPLDVVKSGLNNMRTFDELRAYSLMGDFGGRGWEWIGNFIAIGGAWLLLKKIIRWQIPVGVLAGLLVPAGLFYFLEPGLHASPGFHLFSGGALLGAFFIATDPVSAAIYCIRRWGSYADGVAFAVLLMNMAVPLIDQLTRPRIVGHRRNGEEAS
jgi:electron transport complex protein RnfD